MVLAGGRVDELNVLTLKRPKSAVPFGGIYRIIDFSLTNLMRSGIDRVGILSQYRLSSLMNHVGVGAPWGFAGRRRGVRILPPFVVAGRSEWYKGTADAVYQNLHFIADYQPELVMVLSGDHVYRMDYGPLIQFHLERDADLTVAFKSVDPSEANRFGIATLDDEGRIETYEEKPRKPKSTLASLTIYVFKTQALIRRVMENAQRGKTFQIYSEIIPRMLEEDRVFGYVFDGYWQYSRTIDEYYRANMDLLAEPSPIDLAAWQVRTNPASVRTGDMPPVRFKKGSSAASSIISGGSIVEGEVATSVLSPYVHVKKGARVVDSVLMHETVVEEGAEVVGCILDKGVIVGKDARIGVGDRAKPNAEAPHSLASGVTVIGKGTKIPARLKIGTNCLIYPDLEELGRSSVPDGTTIK